MKAILKIVVTRQIDEEDKNFYKELLLDGDISGIYETFDPECEGVHEIIFEGVSQKDLCKVCGKNPIHIDGECVDCCH